MAKREAYAALKFRVARTLQHTAEDDWLLNALAVENTLKAHWPDRAYFIEVGDEDEGWVQLFQPYDVPQRPEDSTPSSRLASMTGFSGEF